MRAETVALAARYVAAVYPEARDIAVSNLTMSGPSSEEDNVVILVMLTGRRHLHVIAADDGSLAVGEDRVETQMALSARAPHRGAQWVPAARVQHAVDPDA